MRDSNNDDHGFDRDDEPVDVTDVEELLRRYRPIDPPAELRMRILAGLREARVPRAWPWAVAAAALLVVTFGLHIAGDRETRRMDTAIATMPTTAATRARAVEDLAEMLGGDAAARQVAELRVSERDVIGVDVDPRAGDRDVPVPTEGDPQ